MSRTLQIKWLVEKKQGQPIKLLVETFWLFGFLPIYKREHYMGT